MINAQIIRTISTLLVGVLFLVMGDSALSLLIIFVGILFMIPGMVSLITYYRHRATRPMFPFAALGSLLLGLWLAVSPDFFVSIFMYVLGGVLTALGIYQLAGLLTTSRLLPVAWPLYLMPTLVLLLGLFVIFNPFEAAALPFIIIGIGCIISAFNDLVAIYRGAKSKPRPTADEDIEDAVIVK
ncbi:MAG: DUF308 domain-containing protein [Bacteroidaceae bacterium]|nr:DUF308 domain-containing protein [Bacteroidaceae bacterium]